MTSEGLRAAPTASPSSATGAAAPVGASRAGYGSVLALAMAPAFGSLLLAMAVALLLVHPDDTGLTAAQAALVNQQNQSVKTGIYLAAFALVLPLALIFAPRVADRIARGPNASALPALSAALVATLAASIIVVRLSGALPWGDGVKGLALAMAVWAAAAAVAIWHATRNEPWPPLLRLEGGAYALQFAAVALVFGTLLCVTPGHSLSAVPVLLGALVAAGVLIAAERVRWPRPRRAYLAFDVALIAVLILAIPDTVVFTSSSAVPNVFFDPGVVQFQHDWILGSANQLLGGGALLVNVPVSQYGVGLIYFLDAWFHLAPIGYGTFGFLDGLLTALFYVAAYGLLRLAGVRRPLAASALVLAVLTLVYNFQFFVGQLPEEGPLRFGLPMIVLMALVSAARRPAHARRARLVAMAALGVSAVWAVEAFAYTAFTYAAIALVEAWLMAPGERRRWLIRTAALAVAACLVAHVVLALATLAGTGQLPHWGQYLGYVSEFLFGGQAGSITYGFANWSPGLAVDAAALISAAALVLLLHRQPALARRDPPLLVALTGSTAYAIAIASYTDNRSSTYLFLYVAMPVLIACVLWLSLLRAPGTPRSLPLRRWSLAFALAVAVLLLSGAWPAIGQHFSRSALAHAYPGGGLRAALTRLWHPPPIDPRAPVGERLLAHYMPGRHELVLLPTLSDLGLEILMRSGRSSALPIGDPKADSLVPSVWVPIISAAVKKLRVGERMLIDRTGLQIVAALRNPAVNPVTARIEGSQPELAWILHELDLRFRIRVIHADPSGLIVAQLASKGG